MALADIRPDPGIEERVELDHDTRDVLGMRDISASMLEKIDVAAVFFGNLTPIAVSDGGEHLPNPNVLIELASTAASATRDVIA